MSLILAIDPGYRASAARACEVDRPPCTRPAAETNFLGAGAEEWRPVVGSPGYEVSNLGRVRSVDRVVGCGSGTRLRPGCVLAGAPDRDGYHQVALGRRRTRKVHHLVLLAFVGARPDGAVGRHLNDNPQDNRATNLAWGTQARNLRDMVEHGRSTKGERNPRAKLTAKDVAIIRAERERGVPLRALSSRFGVADSCISRVATGARWS